MCWLLHDWQKVNVQLPPWIIKKRGYHPKTPGIQHSGALGLYDAYHCNNCEKVKIVFEDGEIYSWGNDKPKYRK